MLEIQLAVFIEQLPGQSRSNRYNYERRLKPFLELYGRKTITELTAADVNAWNDVLTERGYTEATIAGYRQALKAFLRFCADGAGIASPARHLPTGSFISKRDKRPPERDVVIVASIARFWLRSDNPDQVQAACIFLLSLKSGPRLREIRELRLSEIQAALSRGPDNQGIYRATSIGKTKGVSIRFDEEIAAGLRRWLDLRPKEATIDRCFVTTRKTSTKVDPEPRYRPLSKSGATAVYVRLSKAARLDKPIRSHALRHRLGDKISNAYTPKLAAILLNHKDWETAATAIAYYTHPDESDVSKALASLHAATDEEEIRRLFRPRS